MESEFEDTAREPSANAVQSGAPPVISELSQLMVSLLKGVLYREDDERLWAHLLRLQAR